MYHAHATSNIRHKAKFVGRISVFIHVDSCPEYVEPPFSISEYVKLTANIIKYLTKCDGVDAFMYHELFT